MTKRHIGYKGRPLAWLADREELKAYANVLRDLGRASSSSTTSTAHPIRRRMSWTASSR